MENILIERQKEINNLILEVNKLSLEIEYNKKSISKELIQWMENRDNKMKSIVFLKNILILLIVESDQSTIKEFLDWTNDPENKELEFI